MTKTLRFKNAPLWDGGYARGMKIGSCTIVHIFEDGHALGIDPNDYPELDVESLVVLFHPQEIPTLKLDLSPECMWVGRPYLYRGGIMPRVPVVIVAVTPPNVLYWSCGNVYEMQQSDFLRKYKPVPLSESEPEPPVKVGDVIRVENKETKDIRWGRVCKVEIQNRTFSIESVCGFTGCLNSYFWDDVEIIHYVEKEKVTQCLTQK